MYQEGEYIMARKDIRIAYYEKTDKQKKTCLAYRKRKILKGDNGLLKNMLSIAEENLVKYKSDFYVHDVELVKECEGEPFLWVVRDYGTHFIYLYSDQFVKGTNEWDNIPYFNSILHNFRVIKGIYLHENEELKKINQTKAIQVLKDYEQYMRSVLKKYA